jgi:pimeloyl-ACP methyl ester carboxylesterase
VDICREDKKGQPIDPTKNTWVIIHGWNSSRSKPNIRKLVDSVIATRPEDQVVTLDWSSLAETGVVNLFDVLLTLDVKSAVRAAAKGISPTGKWAAAILKHYGFQAGKINIIGHSFGCYVADQIADNYQPEKLRSIVALDPAANAVPEVFNPVSEVSFLANFIWSWVFHSSDLGNDFVPELASESFVVRTGINLISAHSIVVDFFSDILLRTSSYVASLFNLNRLTSAYFGPWVLNQFYSPFFSDKKYLAYEAIIGAPNGIVDSIEYRINAPVISIDYPSENSVVRDRHIIAQGRVSDIDRGNSGISSVIVNGSTAIGGVAAGSQTAFWSNTVALKLGTNTIQVVATDGSTINPGKATNSVMVTYQPEFIDLPLQVFDELLLASMDLAAEDKALSDRVLSHSLKSGPSGLSVTASGRLDWVPTESQGPSTNLVEVAVTDGFVGTTKRVVIHVREVNTPPSLKAVPDSTLAAGVEWSVLVEGTDRDLPVQQLAYTLKASPAGMVINQGNGTIRWTPSRAQGPGTYPVTVTVADSVGAVVEQSFRVSVSGPAQRPTLAISSANPNGTISLQIRAEQGLVVDLEHSGDLNTWVLAQQITGQTMGQPVQLVLPTDPNTQAVFWRLRLR